MPKIKKIQNYTFDKNPDSVFAWIYDVLIPGKDEIDILFDPRSELFIYNYRGQSEFDVTTFRPEKFNKRMLEKGPITILSTLEDRHMLGEGLVVTLYDRARDAVITIYKGARSGGISVAAQPTPPKS